MFSLLKRSFFRKVFFSYLIVIGLITTVFLGVFYQRLNNENVEKNQEDYSEWAEVMRSTFDRKFDEIKTIGTQIRNTTWYNHAISTGPYYDEFFNLNTKQETGRELVRYAAMAGIVDTLAFALPQRNEMVSTPGWGEMSSIMRLIGIKDSEDQKLLEERLAKPQYFEFVSLKSLKLSQSYPYTIAIVQGVDYSSLNPRASLLILVNNNMMDNYIRKFKPDKVIGFSVLLNNEVLYTYQTSDATAEATKDLVTIRLPSQNYECEYEVQLETASEPGSPGMALIWITVIVTFFLFATAASYLLTRISYRPIAKLLRQTDTIRQQDEFAGIEGSFRRLEGEKKEVERQMQLYYGAARSNFLLSLLRGYFVEENAQQKLESYRIPYGDHLTFRVVLCNLTGESSVASCENLQVFLALQNYLKQHCDAVEFIELSATESAFILCDDGNSDETVRQWICQMQKQIQDQTGRQITICCGTAEKRLLGISKSFQNAKERLTSGSFEREQQQILIAGKNSAYYYPTDWEIQLINSLKVGNEETALKIVGELWEENVARGLSQGTKIKVTSLIFETIVRVIDELGMDTVEPEREFEENLTQYTDKKQWQYLHTLTQAVCRRSSYSEDDDPAGNIGRKMLAYVEQNYHDSALSLKDLSLKFELSTSAVSRTFKTTAKICFYDYLCRIRMEKAKEIFRGEKCCVCDVANQVGYENELSFRRAFLRYEGITPREYILKHTAAN